MLTFLFSFFWYFYGDLKKKEYVDLIYASCSLAAAIVAVALSGLLASSCASRPGRIATSKDQLYSDLRDACDEAANNVASVRVDGVRGLCLSGEINLVMAAQVKQVWSPDFDILIVDLLGGDVMSTLEIVEYFGIGKYDIIVSGNCISSCANWLFPAADEKYILRGAILGWHGGIYRTKEEYIQIIRSLGRVPSNWPSSPDERRAVEDGWKKWRRAAQLQARIFDKRGQSNEMIYALNDAAVCAADDIKLRLTVAEMRSLNDATRGAYWRPSRYLLETRFSMENLYFEDRSEFEKSIITYTDKERIDYTFFVDEACLLARLE